MEKKGKKNDNQRPRKGEIVGSITRRFTLKKERVQKSFEERGKRVKLMI